jgi:hypothetical protein
MCKVENIISNFASNRYFIAIFINVSYIYPAKDIITLTAIVET